MGTLPADDWTKQEPCKNCDPRIYCCDFKCPIKFRRTKK
jgi:hypothetical protein